MKKLALLAAAALAAGCAQKLDPDEIRAAMPRKEAVRIETPAGTGTEAAAAGLHRVAGADAAAAAFTGTSEFAATTYWTAVSVNVGVWWTLFQIEVVTLFPPTECDTESCTWGPHEGDHGNEWRLVVSREGDGYGYLLQARPPGGAGAFATIIDGVAFPGPERHRSNGAFTVFFDAGDALAHEPGWTKRDFGTLEVTYDTRAGASVDAVFLGGRNADAADPFPMNATYAFDATGEGGELQLAFVRLDTEESLALRSRWIGTGAGRGDAQYQGNGLTYQVSECWSAAPAFELVFDSEPLPDYGSEAACAFPSASWPVVAAPAP
jgi:hypothetical protein